jgi:hypothetical protein
MTSQPTLPDEDHLAPGDAARQALADINTVWASWTSGLIDTDEAMAAIRDHLTYAREHGDSA